ncbi:DUF6482 family protein [Enterovibrio makurazakiensis]|uniref:DUF6482 family protein n=1 Tax=Enterovibrio makurazakiensis TaxID=2910232 RepID=UPI003D1D1C60
MKKTLSTLAKVRDIDTLVIHSLDLCLYQASVVIGDKEFMVTDDIGNLVRAHSLLEIQKQCQNINANTQIMRQESAYDEMVGGPSKGKGNRLEVQISDNKLY